MFYSTMTSYMSKDQEDFGFSVHDPFKQTEGLYGQDTVHIY